MGGRMCTRRELMLGMGAALMTGDVESPRDAAVGAFVNGYVQEQTIPGWALVATRNGQVLIERAEGTYYALGNPVARLSGAVLHPLYSFSKLVSATVIATFRQEGVIDYDTPVRQYIPEFRGGGKDGITIRHLMTHSAGIPNPPSLGSVRTPEEWRKGVATVCSATTEWEPGSRTAYHALSGLLIAAEAILRRTGETSWEAACRRRLFDPIGAKSLTFVAPKDTARVAITPQPKDAPKSHFDAFGLAGHPSGGCFGTPRDALRILQLHLNRGRWGSRRILTEAAYTEMHTVQYQQQIDEARATGHNPTHETWGLGPLLRSAGASLGAYDWFGFANQATPGIFGHAGIDTVIGVADPSTQIALFFVTTDSPKPADHTVPLRNGVTDRVFAALR